MNLHFIKLHFSGLVSGLISGFVSGHIAGLVSGLHCWSCFWSHCWSCFWSHCWSCFWSHCWSCFWSHYWSCFWSHCLSCFWSYHFVLCKYICKVIHVYYICAVKCTITALKTFCHSKKLAYFSIKWFGPTDNSSLISEL